MSLILEKKGYKTKYKLIFFYFDSEEISKYCVHENDTCTNWLTRSMYTVIVLVYWLTEHSKQWLILVTYNWINSGGSGSEKSVSNQMRNNVDKFSVRLKQWLHVFRNIKTDLIMGTNFDQKQKILHSLLLWQRKQ